MKPPLSLTLIIYVMVSFLPVGAHAQPSDTRALDWTPVQQLASGREIVVTVKGLPAGTRYFIFADESALTVLNLTDPALPGKAKDVLRDMVSHHPEYLTAGFQGLRQFESQEVRVGRRGIFVADQKVADFERVVERIARTDVVRITAEVDSSGLLRGLVGGAGLAAYCSGRGWIAMAVCGPVGAGLGYASSHKADEVVFPYRAVLPSAEGQVTSSRLPAARATPPEAPSRSALTAASRFASARRLIRADAGRVKEATGVLISDPPGRTIRFDVDGRAVFAIPYDSVTAMHYEQAQYPKRFLRRPSFYLTIHYSDSADQAAFETLRLLSGPEVVSALDTLERDTGRTFERSLATRSFLGVPVRARVGARVAVTDQTGQTAKGTIAQLSTSSLALDESTGAPRIFEKGDVRKIRLLYSPKHDVLAGLGQGAIFAGVSTFMFGALGGCFGGEALGAGSGSGGNNCDVHDFLKFAAPVLAVSAGVGALIGPTIGALRYPFNKAFDVYLGDTRSASTTSAVTIVPHVTKERKGVAVSLRF